MPNQLAKSKRRQSLAEHAAVLAALAEIARREDTTVMALLREGARDVVKRRQRCRDRQRRYAPSFGGWPRGCPARFKTPCASVPFQARSARV